MCIIAYYKKGQRPTKERIDYMMWGNPDGVGIAYNDGKRVYFSKGLVDAPAVMAFIDKIKGFANDIVFHARIATSGGISAKKCHPYPLTADDDLLDVTRYAGKKPIVFHNGVFQLTPESGKNDTQTFIKYALAPIYKADEHGLKNGAHDDMIRFATRGNRLVIMYPDEVKLFGEWEVDDGGVMYSNKNYKKYSYRYYTYDGKVCEYDDLADDYYDKKRYNEEWWEKHGYKAKKGGNV